MSEEERLNLIAEIIYLREKNNFLEACLITEICGKDKDENRKYNKKKN